MLTAPKTLTVLSAAKLNLFLEVGKKYLDGYHFVKTVYQSIDLYDELTFKLEYPSTSNDIRLDIKKTIYSDFVPSDQTNIILKSLKSFRKQAKLQENMSLSIELKKNIPVAGGLAGGSSNAAATLYALNRLFDNVLKQEELMGLACSLGADVPFCLLGGCMAGTGKGDQLMRINHKHRLIILIIHPPPGEMLSAKQVYETFDEKPEGSFPPKLSFEKFISVLLNDPEELSKNAYNSLEEIILQLNYWTENAKSAIDSKGHFSIISGSGPTVFTVLSSENEAIRLSEQLNREGFRTSIHESVSEPFQIIESNLNSQES